MGAEREWHMVILFLFSGLIFGASAATLAVWSGGSVLLAVLAYMIVGTLGAMAAVLAAFLIGEIGRAEPDWPDGPMKPRRDPVSA